MDIQQEKQFYNNLEFSLIPALKEMKKREEDHIIKMSQNNHLHRCFYENSAKAIGFYNLRIEQYEKFLKEWKEDSSVEK